MLESSGGGTPSRPEAGSNYPGSSCLAISCLTLCIHLAGA